MSDIRDGVTQRYSMNEVRKVHSMTVKIVLAGGGWGLPQQLAQQFSVPVNEVRGIQPTNNLLRREGWNAKMHHPTFS